MVPSLCQEVPWLVGMGGSKLTADGPLLVSDGPLPVPGGPLPCQEVPWLVGTGVPSRPLTVPSPYQVVPSPCQVVPWLVGMGVPGRRAEVHLLGEAETAVGLGVPSWFADWDSARVSPFGALSPSEQPPPLLTRPSACLRTPGM